MRQLDFIFKLHLKVQINDKIHVTIFLIFDGRYKRYMCNTTYIPTLACIKTILYEKFNFFNFNSSIFIWM